MHEQQELQAGGMVAGYGLPGVLCTANDGVLLWHKTSSK
jgi:hypothetical protein